MSYVLIYYLVGGSYAICKIDVPVSLADHNVNCRDTDVSLSI
jgi:hypothetical protein